jgi:hypothetical protein
MLTQSSTAAFMAIVCNINRDLVMDVDVYKETHLDVGEMCPFCGLEVMEAFDLVITQLQCHVKEQSCNRALHGQVFDVADTQRMQENSFSMFSSFETKTSIDPRMIPVVTSTHNNRRNFHLFFGSLSTDLI